MLLEAKNIPNLLLPALKIKTDRQFLYNQAITQTWKQYCEGDTNTGEGLPQLSTVFTKILSEILCLLIFCLKNEHFDVINELYKIFPEEVDNSEQMLDRILIHLSLHQL